MGVYGCQHLRLPAGRDPIRWFREVSAAHGATQAYLDLKPADFGDLAQAIDIWSLADARTTAFGYLPVEDAAADFVRRLEGWRGEGYQDASLEYARKLPSREWSTAGDAPPVLELSKVGLDLCTGAWRMSVAFDWGSAASREDAFDYDAFVHWWAPRRMVIGAALAETAGIVLPYRIVAGRAEPRDGASPGLVEYWTGVDEQWALTVPPPPGRQTENLVEVLRQPGFRERQPSVTGTAAQILALRAWLGEPMKLIGPDTFEVRPPLDAIAVPAGWRGEVVWRTFLEWTQPPPVGIDDHIGPLELTLAAGKGGVKTHVQMKGGLSKPAGRWLAEQLGAEAGALDQL